MKSCTAPRSTSNEPRGPCATPHLPAEEGAVAFGVHGAVAAHYHAAEGTFEPHATTLDYVVAAAAG